MCFEGKKWKKHRWIEEIFEINRDFLGKFPQFIDWNRFHSIDKSLLFHSIPNSSRSNEKNEGFPTKKFTHNEQHAFSSKLFSRFSSEKLSNFDEIFTSIDRARWDELIDVSINESSTRDDLENQRFLFPWKISITMWPLKNVNAFLYFPYNGISTTIGSFSQRWTTLTIY